MLKLLNQFGLQKQDDLNQIAAADVKTVEDLRMLDPEDLDSFNLSLVSRKKLVKVLEHVGSPAFVALVEKKKQEAALEAAAAAALAAEQIRKEEEEIRRKQELEREQAEELKRKQEEQERKEREEGVEERCKEGEQEEGIEWRRR